ncbi:MAG: 2-phospho-L-lactate transferase [Anaerolineaceae bacterium]
MSGKPETWLKDLKVVALAGGVGGAKLAVGLDHALEPGNLAVIVNTGDDFEHFGLKICPDLDTVCYSLAGMADRHHGWGLEHESWQVATALRDLQAPTWFQLGDRDLATHLERTRLLRKGMTLEEVTRHFCRQWGIQTQVIPMSNHAFRTMIKTREGSLLSFQEYFVRDQFVPEIEEIIFEKSVDIKAAPQVLDSLQAADLVVLCPSNPWVSIDPILCLPGIKKVLKIKPVVAVSPIIQGKALKGPAAKMFAELGIEPSARSVLEHYIVLVDGYIYDVQDGDLFEKGAYPRIIIRKTNTIMKNDEDKVNLAREVLAVGKILIEQASGHDDMGNCSS